MLDAPCGEKKVVNTDCPKCDALEKVKVALEKLKECAAAPDAGAADAADAAADPAADPAAGGDGAADCMPPNMFSMDLILANEELDKSIAQLYNDIIKVKQHDIYMLTISYFDIGNFDQFHDDCLAQR